MFLVSISVILMLVQYAIEWTSLSYLILCCGEVEVFSRFWLL